MSAKSKHTPGPWSLRDCMPPQILAPDGFPVGEVDEMAVLPDWDQKYPDAEHWSRMEGKTFIDRPEAEIMANARLIAAAPDLLAALVTLVPRFARCCDYAGNEPDAIAESTRAARAAIAKATGGPE